MTDLDPQRSPTLAPTPEPSQSLQPLAVNPTNANKVTPWVLTLFLHGLIFSGAYVMYQKTVKSNQTLTKATAPTSATAITPQKEVLQTLRDSSTPIAINQEAYAPSPKVRSDLPVLTTADIIAQGNAIRNAQNPDKADSAISVTALTVVSAVSSTAKTTKTILIDASDEALTDRDIPAKDRKNGAKNTPSETVADKSKTTKTDKKGTTTTKTSDIQKTEEAHKNSTEAEQLSKDLEQTNADLSRNIDIIKNKNRQKIAKEFNTQPTTTSKTDDSLHSEDVPSKK